MRMSKNFSKSIIAAALMATVSCSGNLQRDDKVYVTFKANIPDTEVKSYLETGAGDSYKMYFANGDRVSIYDDNLSECNFLVTTPNGGNSPTCDLGGTGVFAGASITNKTQNMQFNKTYYAVYPRLTAVPSLQEDGHLILPINTGMLANQIGRDGQLPVSANNTSTVLGGVFVGKSNNGYFKFEPISAYIKLTITQDDILKIRFNNNNTNGPFVSGEVSVDYTGDTPVIDKSKASGGEVTLCADKQWTTTMAPGTYYLVILPTDFTTSDNGTSFKILIHTRDGGSKTPQTRIEAKTPINITPGMVLDLGTIQHD